MARAPAAALLALAALLASAAAQAPAAAAPPASAGDNQRWDAMMARIAGMQAACSPIKEKWQCNSGTDKCEWDEAQVGARRIGGVLLGAFKVWVGLAWERVSPGDPRAAASGADTCERDVAQAGGVGIEGAGA